MRARDASTASGTSDEVIRSPHNPTIKHLRSLGARKIRAAERAFVVEGARAIQAGIDAGFLPHLILLRETASPEAERVAMASEAPIRRAAAPVFDPLANTTTPQGILAVFDEPEFSPPAADAPFLLLLDHVADPGNLGTILRSAAGAGVDAVVLSPGCVDPYNPKVVRAAMGAHFVLPIIDATPEVVAWVRARTPARWLAEGSGEARYSDPIWSGGVSLIIGSEAHGATDWGRDLATGSIRIPLARRVESLNAGTAAAVILFEAARQRGESA